MFFVKVLRSVNSIPRSQASERRSCSDKQAHLAREPRGDGPHVAATRSGRQEYRALVAQWKAQRAAERPTTAKLRARLRPPAESCNAHHASACQSWSSVSQLSVRSTAPYTNHLTPSRLHGELDYRTPNEIEAEYYAGLESPRLATASHGKH